MALFCFLSLSSIAAVELDSTNKVSGLSPLLRAVLCKGLGKHIKVENGVGLLKLNPFSAKFLAK